jgi:hypothetical protein
MDKNFPTLEAFHYHPVLNPEEHFISFSSKGL